MDRSIVESDSNTFEDEWKPMSELVLELLSASSSEIKVELVYFRAVKEIDAEKILDFSLTK